MKITWIDPTILVEHELNQLEQEGRDVSLFRQRWDACQKETASHDALRSSAQIILEELDPLSKSSGSSDVEPSTLEQILSLCGPQIRDRKFAAPLESVLADRIAGNPPFATPAARSSSVIPKAANSSCGR